MTTLYRPVLIESAEQAEALPVGTVATHAAGAGMDHAHKVGLDDHLARGWLSLSADVSDAAMVGWVTLVPIEAEEETVLVYADEPDAMWSAETFRFVREARAIADGRPSHLPAIEPRTRLVTPWEEA